MTTPAGTPETVLVDGEEYYQIKAVLRIPKNWTPESGVFIAVAPPGGVANFPYALKGDSGLPPTFRNIDLVELAPDDPTPATATFDLITPATEDAGPIYDLLLTLHRGEAGDDGTLSILGAEDFDDEGSQAGYVLALKSDGEGGYDGVEAVSMKVGNMYWPTAIGTLTNVTGGNQVCAVPVPAQTWPYRLCVDGQQIINPDALDVQVDLVARLSGTGTGDGSTDGHVIARGQGIAGVVQNLIFSPAPPVGSSVDFGKVLNGAERVVYIRCEQIGSSTGTYDTVAGRGLFSVRVEPLR